MKQEYSKEEIIYEDNVCMAVLPKLGQIPGYVKVFPKQKAKTLYELDHTVVVQLFYIASYAASAVFEGLGAKGTNIIVHDGDFNINSDYVVELHVIPRREDDGINFKWETKEAKPEELDSIKNRITEKTFLIGKEKKKESAKADKAVVGKVEEKFEEGKEEGENYLVKHLIRIP